MFEKLYLKLPVFIQEIIIDLLGLIIKRRRLGGFYSEAVNLYSNSRVSETIFEGLSGFFKAAEKVKYWNEKFKEYGVDINSSDLVGEIKKLPIMNKSDVRDNFESLSNKSFKGKLLNLSTSGTTGSPLSYKISVEAESKLWAIWNRNRMQHGINVDGWMGWFGGKTIVSLEQIKPPYWRTCYPLKQVMFSGYHLNTQTVRSYFDKIKISRLEWIHSYPSQVSLFASLVKENQLGDLPDLKFITLGSETFLESQRQLLREVFPNTKVIQHYGQGEGVAIINEDENGDLYPEQNYSYVEFIETDIADHYRIVGTNYSNLAFPLFRYDTGDICKIIDGQIVSIDGRIEDYITLPDGTKLGRMDHIFKSLSNIKESQLYQPDKDKLIIRLVKEHGFDEQRDTGKLINSARERLGNDIDIKIEFHDSLLRTSNGKLRFVISDI